MAKTVIRSGNMEIHLRDEDRPKNVQDVKKAVAKAVEAVRMNTTNPASQPVPERKQTISAEEWRERMELAGLVEGGPINSMERAVQEYYRDVLRDVPIRQEVRNLLDIDPTSGGTNMLPTKIARDIVLKYPAKNPLRAVMKVTTVRRLEQPILSYVSEGMAQALDLTGGVITFQPIRDRVTADVSDSVVHGSASDLVATIETALASEMLKRERQRIFSESPKTGEEHMSLYSAQNGIEVVTGTSKYQAIENSLKDLPQDIRENASIVMSFADFLDIAKDLAGQGLGSLVANPNMIFNRRIVICDDAVDPVVGDFQCLHANYEWLMFDHDKNSDTGVYTVALGYVFDIRVAIPEAFRIARVA